MEIKRLQTQKESIKERRANGEPLIETLMSGMFGDLKRLPEYNDQSEVYRKACKDISRMDFGDMGSYIDSLVQIADFWQERAEHYFEELQNRDVKFDDNGYVNE
jgi:hypothetical protein